ncbi:molybdate ABC transporter substrate-binding protein [Methanoplanus limicola]|uniref:Molybdenum ABC transporter, periplasmic molybdate-binding protein n=1 Tax=Methanoplanus limicola DSM 2279 TaxID=937775 RepID=H1YXZ3_9EURY|nr:molybdate ABC transporter substrate-binding protein [Methanoplanus limicola]EHQ36928.1 molybdenum ABC transporter, periplasmic molybdate-binding protein [Methanoplanus limicola DSM 2279]
MKRELLLVFTVFAAFALILGAGCVSGNSGDEKDVGAQASGGEGVSEESLIVYCGAGLREPMDNIAADFEEQENVKIKFTYGGSAQLLSQIELLQEGDAYMPGARSYIQSAIDKGFVSDSNDVVYHVMTIAVPKGNPKNITCLEDLTNEGVRVGIGEPDGPAVGSAAKKLLDKNGLWEDIQDNIVVQSGTVNELLVYLNMGQTDAVIIWEDLLNEENMEKVDIPVSSGFVKVVPVGMLTFTEKEDTAKKFIDFVSSDAGKAYFEEAGFDTYPCDKYSEL